MKLSKLKLNPKNPRIIKDDKFKKLVQSLKDFPEMMEKRPMVCVTDVDGKMFPIGGNMRLKALRELGMKEIPDSWVVLADDWTEEQRKEFTIRDNVGFGEWNFKDLQDGWEGVSIDDLNKWGIDVEIEEKENKKSRGTVGNAIISDRPRALVLIEIKDDIDMANFKSIFGDDVWIKNGSEQQKMIFDYNYFIEKIEKIKK
jgi:ParB-like chromosome segregation protein Spo0J